MVAFTEEFRLLVRVRIIASYFANYKVNLVIAIT